MLHMLLSLAEWDRPDTTVVLGEVPIGRTVSQRQGLRIPDLLVAFGVDRAGVIKRHGYSIEEQGVNFQGY